MNTEQLKESASVELYRIKHAEENITMVKEDLDEIKSTLSSIDKEIRLDLSELSKKFSEFTLVMKEIAVKAEERERRTTEIFIDNKAAFDRVFKEIENLKVEQNSQSGTDVEHTTKIASLEKIIYAGLSTLGAIAVWLIQEVINRHP